MKNEGSYHPKTIITIIAFVILPTLQVPVTLDHTFRPKSIES